MGNYVEIKWTTVAAYMKIEQLLLFVFVLMFALTAKLLHLFYFLSEKKRNEISSTGYIIIYWYILCIENKCNSKDNKAIKKK